MNAPELNAMTNCPEVEDLAAFFDRTLPEPRRTAILEHLADCGDCTDILEGLRMAEQEHLLDDTVARPNFGRRTWFPTLVAAAVVVIAFGAMFRAGVFGPRDPMGEIAKAGAALQTRPNNARLSINLPYRQPKRVLRGNETPAEPIDDLAQRAELYELAGRLEEKPIEDSIARAHAQGVMALLTDDWSSAVKHLAQAATSARTANLEPSRKAAILNDYAVALGSAGDWTAAFKVADDAWKLDKTPAIAWTRAVALETERPQDALAAWDAYLRIDPASEWANEVRNSRVPALKDELARASSSAE